MEKKVGFTIFRQLVLLISIFLIDITILFPGVNAARGKQEDNKLILNNGPKKLFVFGDSYADTGNWPPTNASKSWREPYGMTFPGKPSGRCSDGRTFPDYIASYLGIGSPQPYNLWKGDEEAKQYGINFAYGGTGVFDTDVNGPNMTTQINYLQKLVKENVYSKHDLTSSVALVSSAGNDYISKIVKVENVEGFIESPTNQLILNLKRIHEMGVTKVAVAAMQPLGCLPAIAFMMASNYSNCHEKTNNITRFHNQMLKQKVENLNDQITVGSPFIILDLYAAFTSAMNHRLFPDPLKPCCLNECGEVDDKSGKKEYTLCDDPKKTFFWDMLHPSQQGWFAVYSALESSLPTLTTTIPSTPIL